MEFRLVEGSHDGHSKKLRQCNNCDFVRLVLGGNPYGNPFISRNGPKKLEKDRRNHEDCHQFFATAQTFIRKPSWETRGQTFKLGGLFTLILQIF